MQLVKKNSMLYMSRIGTTWYTVTPPISGELVPGSHIPRDTKIGNAQVPYIKWRLGNLGIQRADCNVK